MEKSTLCLGLIVCNIDSEHLGKAGWGETHQLEEDGGHQVETGEGRLRDSHGLQGYEDLKEEV